ncbi:MAG: DUF881 domain-containing protein [bacterium]
MGTPRLRFPTQPAHLARPILYWHYDVNAVVAACVCALLVGMMLAVPFKVRDEATNLSFRDFHNGANPPIGSRQEIAGQYAELEDKYKHVEKELMQERNLKQELETKLAEQEQGSTALLADLQRSRLLAGLLPTEGPGLVLKLSENPTDAPNTEEVGLYLIHQEDLLNIVNELWSAGAEAMAIRSPRGTERIGPGSSIRCVGPVVIVNSQRMGPPFEILAIGNAPTLKQALEIPNGVLAVLSIYNINHEIRESKKLVLPALSGSSFPEYAQIHKETIDTAGSASTVKSTPDAPPSGDE